MKLPIRTDKKPTKVALARLLKIHDQLNEAARGRRRVNCSTLAADLKTTAKTIQRDISYLRDQLKLPIEYDFGERAFSYPDADTPFPLGHNLSQDERIALVVARQSLDVFEGVNFGAELRSAFFVKGIGSGLVPKYLSFDKNPRISPMPSSRYSI